MYVWSCICIWKNNLVPDRVDGTNGISGIFMLKAVYAWDKLPHFLYRLYPTLLTLTTRFMGPTWGPSGANRTQVGPMLAPWTSLSGYWWERGWFTNIHINLHHGLINIIMNSCVPNAFGAFDIGMLPLLTLSHFPLIISYAVITLNGAFHHSILGYKIFVLF